MAYVRFSSGDMYIYAHVNGGMICQVCRLMPLKKVSNIFFEGEINEDFWAYSTQEMVDHIRQHELAGDDFPIRIYQDLWADDERNFPREENNVE